MLVTLLTTGAGCATGATSRAPAPPDPPAPGDIGVTPTIPLNPSDLPAAAPIATDFRVGDAALLLWFSRPGLPIGLDDGWYDTRTGQPVEGPPPTMGWFPTEPVPECFQSLSEVTLPDGDLLDYGWLIGPATAVVMTQGTVQASASTVAWAPEPAKVVFWTRRHGRPLTPQDTSLTPDIPVFTALNEHGDRLCRQAFTSPYLHPRQDG
jgi:hypothetical protein